MQTCFTLTENNSTQYFDTMEELAYASIQGDKDSGQKIRYGFKEDGMNRELTSEEHFQLSELATFYAENPSHRP